MEYINHNVVGFKSRINIHISDCRTGISPCNFLYTYIIVPRKINV